MLQVHSHARKRQQEGKKWGRKSVYMAEKSSECKEMGERSQKEAANALPGNVCVCVRESSFTVRVFVCLCVCWQGQQTPMHSGKDVARRSKK